VISRARELLQLEWTDVWPLTLAWTQWIAQDAGACQVSRVWAEEWAEAWVDKWVEAWVDKWPEVWPEVWPADKWGPAVKWPADKWPAGWAAWDPPVQVPWTTIAQLQCQQIWANPAWGLANKVE